MERVVFAPAWAYSPEHCERVPAIAASLAALRSHFEVDVVSTPCARAGPHSEPSWRGAVRVLAESLAPGGHLLAMASVTPTALVALSDLRSPPRSFLAAGMVTPPATLRALGLHAFADAASAGKRFRRLSGSLKDVMQGAEEGAIEKAGEEIDASIDWNFMESFVDSLDELDLTRESPLVTIPTLYMDLPEGRVFPELKMLFRRFAPDAELEQLQLWPNRMQDPAAGRELAQKVTSYITSLAVPTRVVTLMFSRLVEDVDSGWEAVPVAAEAAHRSLVRRELARYGGSEVDSAEGGVFATFESPTQAVRCAAAIRERVLTASLPHVRLGLHCGEVELGAGRISGIAVNIAARIAALAGPSDVLVSSTVRELLAGSGLSFSDHGVHRLKGISEEWHLYAC